MDTNAINAANAWRIQNEERKAVERLHQSIAAFCDQHNLDIDPGEFVEQMTERLEEGFDPVNNEADRRFVFARLRAIARREE